MAIGNDRVEEPDLDASEALGEVDRVRGAVDEGARWYGRYLVTSGVGLLVVFAILGMPIPSPTKWIVFWIAWVVVLARLWIYERRPPVVRETLARRTSRAVMMSLATAALGTGVGVALFDGLNFAWLAVLGLVSAAPQLIAGWQLLRR